MLSAQLFDAMASFQAGQLDAAERQCRAALAAEPTVLDGYQLLAAITFRQGRLHDAVDVLQTALGHHPSSFEPRFMLGSILRTLGRRAEAMAYYQEALAINPDIAEVHSNMGVLHHDQGELEPAIACYREALRRAPAQTEARLNLAAALRALGRIDEGLAEFETILTFNPDHAYAALMAMHSTRELCRWQNYSAMAARAQELAVTQAGKFSPFLLLSWPVPPDLLLKAATAFAATFTPPQALPPAAPRSGVRKLRIGYVSPDFRDHVVASVIPEVLECHDLAAFDVLAYSYGPKDDGPQRRRIQAACTDFVDVRSLSDDDAARKIRDDGVDILIDLNGFTGSIRHGIPARRPAPVQIGWLGYPGTTGSPAIDYLVADTFTVPADAEGFYSERIIRLPFSCQPHDRKRSIAEAKTREAYGLPTEGFVFCSFNHPQKITPEIFGAWMTILKAVPGSVLWIKADRDDTIANLKGEATAAGVDDRRLVIARRTKDAAEHLARYRIADLALDTLPYNSHTTANDALWLGCPLVTLVGDTMPARIAGGILQALGLPQLVTSSLNTYRETAVGLARAPQDLAEIRRNLVTARGSAAHFDTALFTRNLEAGYREAWKRHAAGETPRHIAVGIL